LKPEHVEVYCWKYRRWVEKCPLGEAALDKCLINCPLKTRGGKKDEEN